MRFLWIVWLLVGILFLASAATENGLLPSGHGPGRVAEVIMGAAALAYGIYRMKRGYGRNK